MPNVTSVKSKTFGDVAAADTASLAALQTLGGAGDMTLKAAAGTGAYNGTNLAQLVDLTCAADVASVTFSVTGTDVNGDTQTEDITGVNANTVAGALYFATVTQVAADGAVGTNTSVGNQAGTGVGVVFAGRTRIRGMQGVVGTTAGNITFKNTSTTGTTQMDIPTGVTAGPLEPYIPDNGVLFTAGAYINAAANVQEGVTVFYDG